MNKLQLKKSTITYWIVLAMIGGGILRVGACFLGMPFQLHPDEPTIVKNAIDIIARHSYLPNVYNRPDHFEIKCCAILFSVYSHIRYGISAADAFSLHTADFYFIARLYTVLCGVMMIPLAYLLTSRVSRRCGIFAVLLTAFLPVFVTHSAYATPDIPLTLFVMLVIWASMCYLESRQRKYLFLIALFAAIGITIKYTAAFACIWIAILVIGVSIRERRYKDILKYGVLLAGIVLLVTFVLAPNLYLNWDRTMETLRFESRTTHLGADGLGFGGNLKFYITEYLANIGYEGIIFPVTGICYCIRKRGKSHVIAYQAGLLFLILTSALALHWDRWGMPMYSYGVLLTACGMEECCSLIDRYSKDRRLCASVGKTVLTVFAGVLLANMILIDGVRTATSIAPETRVEALEFCIENEITEEFCIYDGYTPFAMNKRGTVSFEINQDGSILLPEGKEAAEYAIVSEQMYARYYAEPDRYSEEIKRYEYLKENEEVIYRVCSHKGGSSKFCIRSILQKLKAITDSEPLRGGPEIIIYRLK